MSEREQLARLLASHRLVDSLVGYPGVKCYCGATQWPSFEAHVADAILAAGFRYAPTVLREAADAVSDFQDIWEANDVYWWLRARADDIEAGRG